MTKTWMITGSSRGLGRRLAEAVLETGDNLVATARSTGSLDPLRNLLPWPNIRRGCYLLRTSRRL
jgi:short-subunit dehydrogenase